MNLLCKVCDVLPGDVGLIASVSRNALMMGRFPGFILFALSIRPAAACRRRLNRTS